MEAGLLHVGFRNFVPASRLVAIMSPDSAPVKRLIHEAQADGRYVDMTKGRKIKAVLVMDSGHVVLAAIATDTIAGRLAAGRERLRKGSEPGQEEP